MMNKCVLLILIATLAITTCVPIVKRTKSWFNPAESHGRYWIMSYGPADRSPVYPVTQMHSSFIISFIVV
jgi:hypothetical protein